MKNKKEVITAKDIFDKMLVENEECTSTEMMIEFAKIHVSLAIEEAKKGFKNPDNIRYLKNCYSLENII